MSEITVAWASKSEWYRGQSDRELLDAFTTAQSPSWPDTQFVALSEGWAALTRNEATNVLDTILARDLAYRVPQRDDGGVSVSQAKEFLTLFDEGAQFFTNADPDAFRSFPALDNWSWMPATTSTFDLGVGAICADHIGIYWAQSED